MSGFDNDELRNENARLREMHRSEYDHRKRLEAKAKESDTLRLENDALKKRLACVNTVETVRVEYEVDPRVPSLEMQLNHANEIIRGLRRDSNKR